VGGGSEGQDEGDHAWGSVALILDGLWVDGRGKGEMDDCIASHVVLFGMVCYLIPL